jgi:hypothetical protein
MRTFEFTVPSVPGRALSPNASRKQHWGHRRDARDEMRTAWGYAIKSKANKTEYAQDRFIDPWFSGTVTCKIEVFWPPRRSGMDGDNLLSCFKVGIDQLQEQGIVADDRQLSFAPIVQDKDPENLGFVRVTLEGE